MHSVSAETRQELRAALGILLLALVALKTLLLLVDPQARFFLGDSATYLASAASGSTPADRSFTYPLLIRHLVRPTGSLLTLLVMQALFGLLTALIAFRILVASFQLDLRIAAFIAVVFSIGPEQLFFERMVMAEAAGLLAFSLMLACGFAFLWRLRWGWLIGMALAGIFTVSFRVSLLPLVLGFAPLPPIIAWSTRSLHSGRETRKLASCVLLAVLATCIAHVGYRHWYGRRAHVPADYIAYSGYFRLGLVAPLVDRVDLEGLQLPGGFLDDVRPPLSDLRGRESQLWLPTGLITHLREQLNDREGNRVANEISTRALRRHPLGLVEMGAATLRDYFDPQVAVPRMRDDLGMRQPSPEFSADIERWYHLSDAAEGAGRATPVFRYFGASAGWLTTCLFGLVPLSLLMLAIGWRSPHRAAALLLAATCVGLFAGHALFSHIVSYRYLHAFPLLVWLNAGAIVAFLSQRDRQRLSGTAPAIDPVAR